MNKEYYHSPLFLNNPVEIATYIDKNIPRMLVVALALRPRAYKAIDEVYNKRPELYYSLYKENSDFIEQDKSLFIYPVEIDKKVRQLIGIITHSLRDKKDVDDFESIMNKGFKDVKRFMQGKTSATTFDDYYVNKNKANFLNVDFQQSICEAMAAFYFGIALNKNVGISVKFMELIIKTMEPLNQYHDLVESLGHEDNEEILKSFCDVFNLYYPKKTATFTLLGYLSIDKKKAVKSNTEVFDEIMARISGIGDFYDTVYIDSTILQGGIQVTGEEIQVCILAALESAQRAKENNDIQIDLIMLFISNLHTLSLSKSYNDTKLMANVNAQEEFLHKVNILQKEFSKKEKKVDKEKEILIQKNKQLVEENEKLQQTVEKLSRNLKQKELYEKKTASYEKEIFGLRNFLYSTQEGIEPIKKNTIEENQNLLKKHSIAVFGGHPNFVNKLSEHLPNSRFISSDDTNKTLSFVNKIDAVFIFSEYFNHGMYYKLMKSLANSTKVVYLPKTVNIEQTLDFMSSEMKKISE